MTAGSLFFFNIRFYLTSKTHLRGYVIEALYAMGVMARE